MSRQLLVRLLVPSIVILGVIFLALDRRSTSLKITTVQEPETVPLAAVSVGTATSGKLFKGEKVRKYSERKFRGHKSSAAAFKEEDIVSKDLKCDRWSVVTTIFEPSDAVKKQALMNGWCLVVVGDRKGPHSCEYSKHDCENDKCFKFVY